MLSGVKVDEFYRNIKTQRLYKVIAIGTHTETHESMVVYSGALADVWIRPIDLFQQKFELVPRR